MLRVDFLMLRGEVTSVSIFLLTLLILQDSVLPRKQPLVSASAIFLVLVENFSLVC